MAAYRRVYDLRHLQADRSLPRTGISSGTLRSVIEYGLHFYYVVLYPQNGDRIVTTDWVTSLHRMYTIYFVFDLGGECRVTIRPGFPRYVLFFGLCPGVRVGFRKSAVCSGFWPNPQVHTNVANCKGVDGMRQRKLVSFQYKMSVTSQNAILVQASCTCLLNKSKPNCAWESRWSKRLTVAAC